MKYYLYILYSLSKNKYYIGSSANISKRIERHNAGATPSTKPGRPWHLAYSEEFDSKTEAIQRERYLKRMKSRVIIEQLIRKEKSGK